MNLAEFSGEIWFWKGPAPWHFISVAKAVFRGVSPQPAASGRLPDALAAASGGSEMSDPGGTEAVIGAEGTPVVLDRPVPGEILRRLTYRPRRGPRPVRHVSQDGRLLHSLSVQGIYRLAESSAADLAAVLAGLPGTPIPLSLPPRHQDIPAGTDPLF